MASSLRRFARCLASAAVLVGSLAFNSPALAAPGDKIGASSAVAGTTTGAGTVFGSNCTSSRGPRASEEAAVLPLINGWAAAAAAAGYTHLRPGTTPADNASGDNAVLTFPGSTITATVSRRQVDSADALSNTSTSIGASSANAVFSNAGRLQDCAPRPANMTVAPTGMTLVGTGVYSGLDSARSTFWNATTFPAGNQLDAALFAFSQPVNAFGLWFGDLETRYPELSPSSGGVLARVKLFDASGAVIDVRDVLPDEAVTTNANCGGADQVTDNIGCGNQATRFISFVSPSAPVSSMMVIVGDDDSCAQGECDGRTEYLSWIGPLLATTGGPAQITLTKTANDAPGPWSFDVAANLDDVDNTVTLTDSEPSATIATVGGAVLGSITETAVANWRNDEVACTVDGDAITLPYTVVEGDEIACAITNTWIQPARLTITKAVTGPAPLPTQWAFDVTYTVEGADDTQTLTSDVPSGAPIEIPADATLEAIVEADLSAPWAHTATECMANAVPIALPYNAQSGDDIACTVTNSFEPADGNFTLHKSVVGPAPADWTFSFLVDLGENMVELDVTDDEPDATFAVAYGTAIESVAEDPPADTRYALQHLDCAVNDEPVELPYQVLDGDRVECWATNRYTPEPAQLSLTKDVTGDRAPLSWSFTLAVEIDGTGTAVEVNALDPAATIVVPHGSEITAVTEATSDPWALERVSCHVDGAPLTLPHIAQDAEHIECAITNRYNAPVTTTTTTQPPATSTTRPSATTTTVDPLQVASERETARRAELAYTGQSATQTAAASVLVIAAGAMLVAGARGRRRAADARQ